MWRLCAEQHQTLSDDYRFWLCRLLGWLLLSQPHDHSLCTLASGSHTCLYTGMHVCQVEPPTENDSMSSPTCPPSLIGFIPLRPLTCDFTNKESRLSFNAHFFFLKFESHLRLTSRFSAALHVWRCVSALPVWVCVQHESEKQEILTGQLCVSTKVSSFLASYCVTLIRYCYDLKLCHLEVKVRHAQCSQLYCSSFRELKTPQWDSLLLQTNCITPGFHTMLMLKISSSIGLTWMHELTTIIQDFMWLI